MDDGVDLEPLKALLQRVGKVLSPPVEASIFSKGGRGYYENPASDLLAFFLDPKEDHGLGSTFMSALVQAMESSSARDADTSHLFNNIENFSVHREVSCASGGRMDLLLEGSDWIMIIEIKIYHHQANPFYAYEAYANERALNKRKFFLILSPQGKSSAAAWIGVSYLTFLGHLNNTIGQAMTSMSFSKWHLFAREFVLHLENQLYRKPMTPQQIALIETFADEIEELSSLKQKYREYLMVQLKGIMSEHMDEENVILKDEGWAIRCRSKDWGNSNIAWWYSKAQQVKLKLTVYIEAPNEAQRVQVQREFDNIWPNEVWTEGSWWCWATTKGFDSRSDAEDVLRKLIPMVNSIFVPASEPGPVDQVAY